MFCVLFFRAQRRLQPGGLKRSDGHDVDDVVHRAAARQVVDRLVHALEHGADGLGLGQPLDELVGDIARLEVRKDEHVGLAGNGRAGRLGLADPGDDGRIGLQFAVDLEVRGHLPGDLEGAFHLVHELVLGAAVRREGQQGDLGVQPAEDAAGLGRGDGDLGQLLVRRVGHDRAVGEDEHALLSVFAVGDNHDERARDDADPRLGLDELEGRADGIGRGMQGPGYQAVGVALVDHHRPEEDGVLHDLARLLGRHALGLAQLAVRRGVVVEFLRRLGIERWHGAHVHALILGRGFDLRPVADQGDVGQLLARDDSRGLDCPGLFALGEDDPLGIFAGLVPQGLNEVHDDGS
jgi:hypothetical protein